MILVVEDDPQVARLIALVLERDGYEVEVLSDGISALKRIGELRPAMVLADLTYMGVGGDVLCRRRREDDWTRTIHCIVRSGCPYIA